MTRETFRDADDLAPDNSGRVVCVISQDLISIGKWLLQVDGARQLHAWLTKVLPDDSTKT